MRSRRLAKLALALALPLFAALLCGLSCASLGEAKGRECVEALRWASPNDAGFPCAAAEWRNEEPKNLSSGPYEIELLAEIDLAALKKRSSDAQLVSFEWAKAKITPDGRFKLSRCPEDRNDSSDPALSQRALGPEQSGRPLKILFSWTGQELLLKIDGDTWASLPSRGTRVWGELRAGPFPGSLRAVTLRAF